MNRSQKERKVKRTVIEIQLVWMVMIETKSNEKEEATMMKSREVCVSSNSYYSVHCKVSS